MDSGLQPGTRVERYLVLDTLGVGGMASVYAVRHVELGTFHALKVLTLRSPDLDRRFKQEGKTQAQLRHPNIVPVTDVLTLEDGAPALLMEYVGGPPLDLLLANYRPSVEEALRIIAHVATGVGHANAQGFIHRDLKPGNILLALEGAGIRPKVVDFGLAKALFPDDPSMKTRTGMTMGTPTFMAPEQTMDASNVDARVDVYAIAAILYLMLTGRPPYPAKDLQSIIRAHMEGPPPRPSTLDPRIDEALDQTIMDALALHPGKRIADCGALLARLDLAPDPRPLDGGGLVSLCRSLEAIPSDPDLNSPTLEPREADPSSHTWVDDRVSAPPTSDSSKLAPPLTSPPSQPSKAPFVAAMVGVGALFLLIAGTGSVGLFALAWLSDDSGEVQGHLAVEEPSQGHPPHESQPAPHESQPASQESATAPHESTPAPTPQPAPPPAPPATEASGAVPSPDPPLPRPVVPEGTPVPTGIVRVEGDAAEVYLTRNGRRQGAGVVPTGTYQAFARFGEEEQLVGPITVTEGQSVTIRCVAVLFQCTIR